MGSCLRNSREVVKRSERPDHASREHGWAMGITQASWRSVVTAPKDLYAEFPDLPFSEDEIYRAYRRLVPDEEARENAQRLVRLPTELRAEAEALLSKGGAAQLRNLVVDDDVFASLAVESPAMEDRVRIFLERRWVDAELAMRRRLLARGSRSRRTTPVHAVTEEAARFAAELRRDWERCLDKVRHRTAHSRGEEKGRP